MKTVTEEEAVQPCDVSIWLLLTVSTAVATNMQSDLHGSNSNHADKSSVTRPLSLCQM